MKILKSKIFRLSIAIFIPFIALSLCFLFGSFHGDTKNERVANYASQVVINNTANKQFCGVAVDTPNKPTQFYDTEFINLFGVFLQRQITYASALNADKNNEVKIDEIDSHNLSLFYLGPTGSITQYDGGIKRFRHARYNIYTMFEDPIFNGTYYDINHLPVIYLSYEQATKLLESMGFEKGDNGDFGADEFRNLLQKPLELKINGNNYYYYIWNIYFNSGFYCDGLSDVLGEYVLTSYFQAENLLDTHKSIYFFNKYDYQNNYFISYINDRYAEERPDISILRNNIIGEIDDNYLLSFYYSETLHSLDWVFSLTFILSIIAIIFDVFLVYRFQVSNNLIFIFIWFFCSILPYIVFKIIFLSIKDTFFFSNLSCKTNFLLLILLVISFGIAFFFKKRKTCLNNGGYDNFHELDI